jgi:hypothetical protein
MSRNPSGKPTDRSSDMATTQSKGGYPEKHGPRSDPDGWGEENAERSQRAGTSEGPNQGHAAGERSFDHGPDDTAADDAADAADAAGEASRREPGERGPDDASEQPVSPGVDAAHAEPASDPSADEVPPGFSEEGSQRDYGQGGGQGYLHTGKPGAPDPDGKPD